MISIQQIDALLPQTQCGQCSYAGCLPYAEAMANHNENINRCPPGGVKTLFALAELLNKDATPFITEMRAQEKQPQLAVIRDEECIGCTKCIQACPVDAILGAAKQLHSILQTECTGCGLCVEPCPVDCIDMQSVEKLSYQPAVARSRHYARQQRLAKKQKEEFVTVPVVNNTTASVEKNYVLSALERVRAKRK